MLLLIVILLLVFGGGGGYYGYSRWGSGGGIGIVGLVVIILELVSKMVLRNQREEKQLSRTKGDG